MTREYYQKHRDEIIRKEKARHEINKTSRAYRLLTNARKKRVHLRDRLQTHKSIIWKLQERIRQNAQRIERLELAWGKERAERKSQRVVS